MAEVEKSVLGSVRLDSDVWDAVRGMPVSLNQYLRRVLLEMPDALERQFERVKKKSRKDAHVEALKASDPLGADRKDIEHGNMELPSGGSVAVVGAAIPVSARVRPRRDVYQAEGGQGAMIITAMGKLTQ